MCDTAPFFYMWSKCWLYWNTDWCLWSQDMRQLLGMPGLSDFSRDSNTAVHLGGWLDWLGQKEAGSWCLLSPMRRVSSTLHFWYLASISSGLHLVCVWTQLPQCLGTLTGLSAQFAIFLPSHSFEEHTRSRGWNSKQFPHGLASTPAPPAPIT